MSKFCMFIKMIILKSFDSLRSSAIHKTCYYQRPRNKDRINQMFSLTFISWLIKSNPGQSKIQVDTEKQISNSINQAEEFIVNGKLKEAKQELNKAIEVAVNNAVYENLPYLCDLLSSIALSEGDFYEAENILVKFTEKFLQLGYPETHNTIVTFKLKIARIYQILGSSDMAEFGFRDCIRVQEKKLGDQKQLDEESNGIYLTALFWYGKLLADQQDYKRAQSQYKLCWERILKSTNILPPQKIVVLHSIGNVSASLKDFDEALHYLYSAIEICLLEDPNNKDLPILTVQVGLIFLQKKMYENASLWCETGYNLAEYEKNEVAKTEGLKCISELRKLKLLQ